MEMITLKDCILECAGNRKFVAGYESLTSNQLVDRRAPLDRMIDDACGLQVACGGLLLEGLPPFIAFVYEVVWCRLPESVRAK